MLQGKKSQPALPYQHMERFTGMSQVVGRQFTSLVFIVLLCKGLKLTLKCSILYSSSITYYSGFYHYIAPNILAGPTFFVHRKYNKVQHKNIDKCHQNIPFGFHPWEWGSQFSVKVLWRRKLLGISTLEVKSIHSLGTAHNTQMCMIIT